MTIELLSNAQDIEDVLSIAKERNLSHSLDMDTLKDSINHIVYIAKEEKTIGYILYTLEGEEAEIDSIAVRKEYEGKEYGTKIMTDSMGLIKSKGVNRLLLEVNIENERAIRLYEKMGFVRYRIRKGYYDGEDAICMERRLDN